uniref:Uncharacterized protein n=1 Tax=Cacopsylla melanoneura TaxID=428564 RepID=A0A8D9E930_9HEMI
MSPKGLNHLQSQPFRQESTEWKDFIGVVDTQNILPVGLETKEQLDFDINSQEIFKVIQVMVKRKKVSIFFLPYIYILNFLLLTYPSSSSSSSSFFSLTCS